MVAYKTVQGTNSFKQLVHLTIQCIAVILSLVGVWTALKFHNDKGIDNFYSLHSWAALLPWHVFFGIAAQAGQSYGRRAAYERSDRGWRGEAVQEAYKLSLWFLSSKR
ncbi:Detected protein of confused Function [Hibiscus syriacus]|uniref:Detected protein of confused Function n=2 Tax=Hibiscus syriacus TaxID=106335 RepID=A0A6A2XXG1_HIBSY|nr:Detected protein of confused Function [Hibiscus syriacus]